MGHSIGDGIIVAALAAAFLGYIYLKAREGRHRLEILHQERLAAMDKGVPLPELPIDPPVAIPSLPGARHVPLILGIVLTAFGGGAMVALGLALPDRTLWPLPLPVALMGAGPLPRPAPRRERARHRRVGGARRPSATRGPPA